MTSTDDQAYQSLTGTMQSAEPASAADIQNSKPAAPPLRNQPLAAARSQNLSRPSSSATSPLSSRDASPARPPLARSVAPPGTNNKTGLRSRMSSADASPSRGSSLAGPSTSTPSATAIKRALSASNVPELPSASASSDMAKAPRPLKSASASNSGDSTPRWPISPRLRSPPPSGEHGRSRSRTNSLRSQLKKADSTTPAIVVQSSSPASTSRFPVREEPLSSDPDEPTLSIKVSPRNASNTTSKLETVQESSLPTTPGFDGIETQSFISTTTNKSSDEESNDGPSSSKVSEDLSSKPSSSNQSGTINNESGSDGGSKPNGKTKDKNPRASSATRSNTLSSKASLSSLSNRYRADPPLRNMTVETETVPSVAQTGMGNQDRSTSGRVDSNLRLKPSNETIRPRKDRKAPKRKAPSIHSGTASSKADVFEQKVASAVDEANSSDSDATFIYESNPPEQYTHRSRQQHHHHHHSRTPSMTSVSSMADPRLGMRDSHKNPNKKSSMKFTNPYSNPSIDADMLDRGDGTVRGGSVRSGVGSHHHHPGRHGQGRGALTHLVPDSDSSMAQSSRARGPSPRQVSQPNSPRFHTFSLSNGHGDGGAKRSEYSTYDMDGENVADDEQTPLLSSGRNARVRTPRRRNSLTLRELERRHRNTGGWCRRFAGCLVLSILLLVVIFSSVGLVFATTKPLTNLKVREVQNVVATQEEIMMELIVGAVNPNIIGVTVSDMDVVVFAKSKHTGSDKWWREHGNGPSNNEEDWESITDSKVERALDGVDEGTDPVEGGPRTMVLGHIFHFDSPLNFDGSFFQRHRAESIGEIRLSHPGNKTEAGGTERWEEVLQYPFELIVQGNIKYTLPLSTREHKVAINGSYYYDPEAEKKNFNKLGQEKEKMVPKTLLYPAPSLPTGRYDRRALSLLKF